MLGSDGRSATVCAARDHPNIDAETFFYIRRTRADPPGRAGEPERRATYGTALEQFEELLGAAETASPGVRPLPLFYAVSQAGRAIAAANLPDSWKLHGHGLSCKDLSPESVLDLEIEVQSKPASKPDSFQGATVATESKLPTETMKLGALWMALPEVCRLIADMPGIDRWPEALLIEVPEDMTSPLFRFDRVAAQAISHRYPEGGLVNELDKYPYSEETTIQEVPGAGLSVTWSRSGPGLNVFWPTETHDLSGRLNTLDRIVPTAPGGGRWWRPRVGGAAMNDLMMWWALLFGLSMLARYEPAGWNAMLDLDRAPVSSHLVRMMDAAVDALPWLVLQALELDYVAAS